MQKLSEIRQKYPQYSDMSDEDLANSLHKKYYSDIPIGEYYSKIGLTQKEESEPKDIFSDILGSVAQAPINIAKGIVSLPSEISESAGQISENPTRAIGNVGAGLLEGLKGGVNIPSNIASYLKSRNIGRGKIEDLIASLHIPDTGLEKYIFGENQPGDELLRSIGSFAPYARLGGLAQGLKGAAKRATASGAYAAGQEEDPLTAALMGLAVEGTTRGAQSTLRPGKFLPSSPLTSEQLKEALDITKGTETSLGNVIENPFWQRQFENVFPNLPFSGANEAMGRTANTITARGENLLNNLKGEQETSDIGTTLKDALKSAESETRKIKTEKFDALNNAADEAGIKTNRSNMRDEAKKALTEIEDDPDLSVFMDSNTKRILENLAAEKRKGDYSLKKTDLLRGDIGEAAHDAYAANNTKLSSILKNLKKAAEKDINQAIDKANIPRLNELRNEAMDFYKKEYVPFKEPEIMKFTKKGGDPDLLISTFLKRSQSTDRAKLLEKLSTKLTDRDRKLVAYSYFSKALEDGKLNPLKFKTLYKNLGENQKKVLLGGDEGVKQFGDYSKLVQKNTEPLNLMFNPKTGQRTLSDYLLSILGGSTGALATGNVLGGLAGGLAPGIAARGLTKALTKESIREKLIKKMIEEREKGARIPSNIAPFIQEITEVSGNQQ